MEGLSIIPTVTINFPVGFCSLTGTLNVDFTELVNYLHNQSAFFLDKKNGFEMACETVKLAKKHNAYDCIAVFDEYTNTATLMFMFKKKKDLKIFEREFSVSIVKS